MHIDNAGQYLKQWSIYMCVFANCVNMSEEGVEGLSGSWELADALLQQALPGLTCVCS